MSESALYVFLEQLTADRCLTEDKIDIPSLFSL